MITAKEFAESNQYDLESYDEGGYLGIDTDVFAEKLVEYAKLAIEQDRINVAEHARFDYSSYFFKNGEKCLFKADVFVDKNSILNAPSIELL